MQNKQAIKSLFDLSVPGRRGSLLPPCDTPTKPITDLIPEYAKQSSPVPLPEVAEPDVIRHFVNLSNQNMSVDTHFYPLGSCTNEVQPQRHERLAMLPGIVDVHPYQDESTVQGYLEMLYEMQEMLAEISGLPSVSIQPCSWCTGRIHRVINSSCLLCRS